MRLPGRLIHGRVHPDRWTALRFASLRWAALPVVDRRWTAPLSAIALGFGLFVGVAIGPGTQGSLGTTTPLLVRVPSPDAESAPKAPRGAATPSPKPPRTAPTGGGDTPEPPATPITPPSDTSTPSPLTTPSFTPSPVAPAPSFDGQPTSPTETDEETNTDEDTTTLLAGTVVHLNPKAGSYSIASDGELIAIHTGHAPDVGQNVEVEARQLANGTYGEDGNRERAGRRGQVELGGTISFRDPKSGIYTVSAPGVSVLVRGRSWRPPPAVGEQVAVEARIADHPEELPVTPAGEDGCGKPPALPKPPPVTLEQVRLQTGEDAAAGSEEDGSTDPEADGKGSGEEDPGADEDSGTTGSGDTTARTTDIEAIVEGVCRSPRKLIVSADDVRESGRDIAVEVPARLRLGDFEPGGVVKLSAEIHDSGTYELVAAAGDERRDGADDTKLIQP